MDLIIVVVSIVVLYISCSSTEHILSFSAFEPKREKDNKFLLLSFNPTTFYFSLSLFFAQSHNELLFFVVYTITSVVIIL